MTEIAPPTSDASRLVPGWLERLAAVGWRVLATIALGLVLIWIAVLLGTVTASILVAAIVAATFAPFVLTLRRRGWSRIKAAAAVFLGAMFVILATLAHHRPRLPAVHRLRRRRHRGRDHEPEGHAGEPEHPARGGNRHRPRDPGPADLDPDRAVRHGRQPGHDRDDRAPGDLPDVLLHDGWRQGLGLGDGLGQPVATGGHRDGRRRRSRPGRWLPARHGRPRRLRRHRRGPVPGAPRGAERGSPRRDRVHRPVHPLRRGTRDHDHPAARHVRVGRSDRGHRPARPDRDPGLHPGQIPGARRSITRRSTSIRPSS